MKRYGQLLMMISMTCFITASEQENAGEQVKRLLSAGIEKALNKHKGLDPSFPAKKCEALLQNNAGYDAMVTLLYKHGYKDQERTTETFADAWQTIPVSTYIPPAYALKAVQACYIYGNKDLSIVRTLNDTQLSMLADNQAFISVEKSGPGYQARPVIAIRLYKAIEEILFTKDESKERQKEEGKDSKVIQIREQ